MEKRKIFIILLFIFVIFMLFYGNIKVQKPNPDVDYFDIYLEIGNIQQIEAKENSVFFVSQPGKTVSGFTVIRNDGNKTNEIRIFLGGELAENGWLSVSEKEFKIKPGEEAKLGLKIEIPENAEGNYTSKLRIESR